MKYQVAFIVMIFAGISVAAAADCEMAEAGKALAEKDRCAICHKEGGMAAPMAGLAEGKTDDFLKQAILNPKEALGPKTRMPAYKYNDEEIKAMTDYLRSLSKP